LSSSPTLSDTREGADTLRIPAFWLALGISLLLHLAIFWQWREHLPPPAPGDSGKGAVAGQLRATLRSPLARPPAAAPPLPQGQAAAPNKAARKPAKPPPSPPKAPTPPAAPPVLAMKRPEAPASLPVQPQPREAAPAPAPAPADDMSAMLEARRRARAGAAAPSVPTTEPAPPDPDRARSDRNIAANLGTLKAPMVGDNTRHGGGVFQLQRLGIDSAEFLFFGWNRDMRRNMTQSIDVSRGSNPDIKIAVVRKMIAIIREYEQGDFTWESRRMRRVVTLSARATDTAGLEEFLLREFF
jgi:hypothetical protein